MTVKDTILMLHPLNPKLLDPSCYLPLTPTPALSKSKHPLTKTSPRPHKVPRSSTPPSTPSTPTTPAAHAQDNDAENTPRKRLKTTADQISMLEEWFQREPLPPRKVREEMVLKLDGAVSLRQLEVWFQNRRAKQKKAEARAQKSRAGEVPSATPPSSPSPSPPATPPSVSLHGMAPNPSALIPSTSPAITPRKSKSKSNSKTKINSQGTSVAPRTPSPLPFRNTSPVPSSPLPPPTPSPSTSPTKPQ